MLVMATWHLTGSSHRIATLSFPHVSGLWSFIGAYKVLARVVKGSASLLAPLDDVVAGRDSNELIVWSDDNRAAFTSAQTALSTNRYITLPRRHDQLWVVTDGSIKQRGLGATLYITRDDKVQLAGFFNAKLRKNQVNWLPCEVEALSIAAAITHFSPYIIQSDLVNCVLTDSKPCVQVMA
jgi:hypothetical protein